MPGAREKSPLPHNCGPRAVLKTDAQQGRPDGPRTVGWKTDPGSTKGAPEERGKQRGPRKEGHGRKKERKPGSVGGGGRKGRLVPAAPALGMCHPARRGVRDAKGRRARAEARGPSARPGCPGGRGGSEEPTAQPLTWAARQAATRFGRRDRSAATKGRHGAAARAPIGGVRGGAPFKPTPGGASPGRAPARRLQPLGSRAGPPRPPLPGLPAPRSAPTPCLSAARPPPRPRSQDAARSGSQDPPRPAAAPGPPGPTSPCARPRPRPPVFSRSSLPPGSQSPPSCRRCWLLALQQPGVLRSNLAAALALCTAPPRASLEGIEELNEPPLVESSGQALVRTPNTDTYSVLVVHKFLRQDTKPRRR